MRCTLNALGIGEKGKTCSGETVFALDNAQYCAKIVDRNTIKPRDGNPLNADEENT